MDDRSNAPPPRERPRLAYFIWARGLDWRSAGEHLGMSGEGVRSVCLPFDDPKRRVPRTAAMARIVQWTGGEITPADFYPPFSASGPSRRLQGQA